MLSALIITKNEQAKIKDCLESVKFVDEIILIDANSKDKTRQIAQQYTNKIFTRKFDNFKNQKNFGLKKCAGDWILAIDADERITDELSQAIQKELKNPKRKAYAFAFLTHFMGHPLRYGLVYPAHHIRLFKNKNCGWKRDVHEQLYCEGEWLKLEDKKNVGFLSGDVIHYSFDSINHYFKKFVFYTDIDAKEMAKTKTDRFGRSAQVDPGSVWSILWFLVYRPIRLFVRRFIRFKGYKDGVWGLIYALLSAIYDMVVKMKYVVICLKQNPKQR